MASYRERSGFSLSGGGRWVSLPSAGSEKERERVRHLECIKGKPSPRTASNSSKSTTAVFTKRLQSELIFLPPLSASLSDPSAAAVHPEHLSHLKEAIPESLAAVFFSVALGIPFSVLKGFLLWLLRLSIYLFSFFEPGLALLPWARWPSLRPTARTMH